MSTGWQARRYRPEDLDWIREHGGDLIPVKLIDLLTVVGRLGDLECQRDQPPDLLIMRLCNSDLPRLRAYLPDRALEEL